MKVNLSGSSPENKSFTPSARVRQKGDQRRFLVVFGQQDKLETSHVPWTSQFRLSGIGGYYVKMVIVEVVIVELGQTRLPINRYQLTTHHFKQAPWLRPPRLRPPVCGTELARPASSLRHSNRAAPRVNNNYAMLGLV